MKTDNLNEKIILIKELVNSGINVTPSIMDFLQNLEDPLKKIKFIIKNISFLPDFNSHLTVDVLRKITDEELQKELQKVFFKKNDSKILQEKNVESAESTKLINSPKVINLAKSKLKIIKNSTDITQLENQLENQEDSLILKNTQIKTPIFPIKTNSKVRTFYV
ncbi:MAG: hypothetical protein ACFFC3_05365 [Candidatus Odinarchaeota archaeon]